ncbi:Lipase (class 3) [Treponema bryantii]|uniref:Lipase (Class 3) n=1 Tax=Treponema bryantii TaxID=163 RepID=A0A1H9IVI8_9SPIR|nr:hypothetical protein [Treponema bryantii]SEQ78537.1 Lipase (class 3) [Treponema bryantii]
MREFCTIIIIFVSLAFISCKTTNQLQDTEKIEEETVAEIEIAPPVIEIEIKEEEPETPKLTPEEEEAIRWAGILKESESMTTEQRKFYLLKKTRDYEVVGEDLDYKIMVNDDTKEVIIQFEESDSDEDWRNNYLFLPWPLKLDNKIVWTTYGYAKVYKSANNIPIDEFFKQIELHPDYKVVIWGWSIGSAMAKITARHFEIRTKKQKKIDELTTWGDVKCWYNPFYSVKKSCIVIHEYVNINDLVTWCIPICRRDVKCRVGDKFSFKKARNSEHYHLNYHECDFSKWEE